MISDPLLLEVHIAHTILAAADRQSPRMTADQKRRISRAAKLHYNNAVEALIKSGQKEKV